MHKPYLFIFFILLSIGIGITNTNASNQKMKIIYVYDPLCGWCYGFSPVIQEVYKNYQNTFDFEIVSGGMRVGDNEGPIGEVAAYIGTAYQRVENYTGVKFGDKFLNDILAEGSTHFSSLPASIALAIFREKYPEKAIEFGSRIQKAIYYYGQKPAENETFIQIAGDMDYDKTEFSNKMEEKKYLNMAHLDFQRANSLGARGYPTVLIDNNGEVSMLTSGYVTYEDFEVLLRPFLTR